MDFSVAMTMPAWRVSSPRSKKLLYQIPAYRMSMDEVKPLAFRYVFIYYNQHRVYTANLGGLPPAAFRWAALGAAA